jgi:hypothetical protein
MEKTYFICRKLGWAADSSQQLKERWVAKEKGPRVSSGAFLSSIFS